jgi:hypothetical protein
MLKGIHPFREVICNAVNRPDLVNVVKGSAFSAIGNGEVFQVPRDSRNPPELVPDQQTKDRGHGAAGGDSGRVTPSRAREHQGQGPRCDRKRCQCNHLGSNIYA